MNFQIIWFVIEILLPTSFNELNCFRENLRYVFTNFMNRSKHLIYRWVKAEDCRIPDNAVEAGFYTNGEKIYIGRSPLRQNRFLQISFGLI